MKLHSFESMVCSTHEQQNHFCVYASLVVAIGRWTAVVVELVSHALCFSCVVICVCMGDVLPFAKQCVSWHQHNCNRIRSAHPSPSFYLLTVYLLWLWFSQWTHLLSCRCSMGVCAFIGNFRYSLHPFTLCNRPDYVYIMNVQALKRDSRLKRALHTKIY